MSTSESSGRLPAVDAPAIAPIDPAAALAQQIERLANELFFGVSGAAPGSLPTTAPTAHSAPFPSYPGQNSAPPFVGPVAGAPGSGGPSSPPHLGPSALAVGSGGASPALRAPPAPGLVTQPPLPVAPIPKESDLRTVPAMLSESLGFASPITLAGAQEPSGQPYFLDLAGPSGSASAAPQGPLVPPPAVTGSPGPWATPNPGPYALAAVSGTASPTPSAPPPYRPPQVAWPPDERELGTISTLLRDSLALSLPTELVGVPDFPSTPPPSLAVARPTGTGLAVPSRGHGSEWLDVPADGLDAPAPAEAPTVASYDFRPELVPDVGASPGLFDGATVRRDFPILQERVHGRPLVWLDNAATTQKPQVVIDRLSHYYEHENSNVHRGAHTLAARATDAYEAARDTVRRFLNAPSPKEIVFVRGATEAINLVAKSWGQRHVAPGDEIVITWLEHHANIVPWQQLCSDKGACLRVAPVDSRGQVVLEEYEKLLGPRTRLVSITHVSNALGTVVPVREMIEMAHRHGALAMVDGAQAVSHIRVDVQSLDCDFYCFSGHKVFAPTGIGVLYGKREVLAAMPPWQGGGNMISDVTFEKTTYQPPPGRFEAGTGSIGDAAGLATALDYLAALGLENVSRYEHELLVYGTEGLATVPGLRIIGTAQEKVGVLSFVLDGVRTEDVGAALDQEGIAVRSGHHCAQPILRRFGLEATVRASLAPYNTREDIDALVAALLRLQTGHPSARPSPASAPRTSVRRPG
jgi:cysteine desulfurase / selenocysteine lyase